MLRGMVGMQDREAWFCGKSNRHGVVLGARFEPRQMILCVVEHLSSRAAGSCWNSGVGCCYDRQGDWLVLRRWVAALSSGVPDRRNAQSDAGARRWVGALCRGHCRHWLYHDAQALQ